MGSTAPQDYSCTEKARAPTCPADALASVFDCWMLQMSRGQLPPWQQPTEASPKPPLTYDTETTGLQAPLPARAASSSRMQTSSVEAGQPVHRVTCRSRSHATLPNSVAVAMTSSWRSGKPMPTAPDADSKASKGGHDGATVVVAQHIGMRGLASMVAALGTGQRRVQSPKKFEKRIPQVFAQVWDDIIDAHVPEADATLPDSDSDDGSRPTSPAAKLGGTEHLGGKCSRTATTARRLVCPGSSQSRIMYGGRTAVPCPCVCVT